jgi:hypothetical protein
MSLPSQADLPNDWAFVDFDGKRAETWGLGPGLRRINQRGGAISYLARALGTPLAIQR